MSSVQLRAAWVCLPTTIWLGNSLRFFFPPAGRWLQKAPNEWAFLLLVCTWIYGPRSPWALAEYWQRRRWEREGEGKWFENWNLHKNQIYMFREKFYMVSRNVCHCYSCHYCWLLSCLYFLAFLCSLFFFFRPLYRVYCLWKRSVREREWGVWCVGDHNKQGL